MTLSSNRADILEALAERVEQASGPDRELDWLVGDAIGAAGSPCGGPLGHRLSTPPPFAKVFVSGGKRHYDGVSHVRYTASLDAAMTLAPEGAGLKLDRYWLREGEAWSASLHTGGIPTDPARAFVSEDAHSAALALTSACLRAHASIFREKRNG